MNGRSDSPAHRLETAIRAWLAEHRSEKPLLVGICGSQGSGKSTACEHVARALSASGTRVAVLSIDDLYLSRAARESLASSVHPLLLTRGVPGTHEPSLGLRIFDALATPGKVLLPRFDKASDDREPESRWVALDAPVDLILFEGWCVGARPQMPQELALPVNALEREEDPDGRWRGFVNDALARDYLELFARIDFQVMLAAPAFEVVVRWRTQQERQLRAARPGATGVMTDAVIERFVRHYERLTRHILVEMPARADLVLRLDDDRRVL
jgi:D-glycerate 3-kinase